MAGLIPVLQNICISISLYFVKFIQIMQRYNPRYSDGEENMQEVVNWFRTCFVAGHSSSSWPFHATSQARVGHGPGLK